MQRIRAVVVGVLIIAGATGLAWWMMRAPDASAAGRGARVDAAPQSAAGGDRAPAAATRAIVLKPYDPAADAAATMPAGAASQPAHVFDITGKVLDQRRRAQANVIIDVSIAGHAMFHGLTGADGRFAVDVGERPAPMTGGCVRASDASGHVALRSPFYLQATTAASFDVGILSLVDGWPLTVRVRKGGSPVAGARVCIGTLEAEGVGPLMTGADGTIGPLTLPAGTHTVVAFAGDAGRGEAEVQLPRREQGPVDVAIEPAWRLRVTVRDGATQLPVPGVHVDVTTSMKTGERAIRTFQPKTAVAIAPTDALGVTVVDGLPMTHAVTVEAVLAEAVSLRERLLRATESGARATLKPGTESAELVLAAGRTVTFPIVPGETDGPPDGAEVKLSIAEGTASAAPPPTGRVVGRELIIDRVTEHCRHILATAPDGSAAALEASGESNVGSPAKFKQPRTLTVSAHARDGTPLTGYTAQVHNQGNVPIGKHRTLDVSGVAEFSFVYSGPLDVRLARPGGNAEWGWLAGNADLTEPGDARVDIVVEAERACVLHVTVDGERRLPGSYSLRIAGADVGPVDEDPDGGVLRFNVRPESPAAASALKLTVSASRCPSVTVDLVEPPPGRPMEAAVSFVTGSTLRVHIVPPADNIHDVVVERATDTPGGWVGVPSGRDPAGRELGKALTEVSIGALPAGRYRARDALTGRGSEPADVLAGASADLTLDLSRVGEVSVRVEGPTDGDYGQAAVVVEEVDAAATGARPFRAGVGTPVRLNAECKVRVPGDRPVAIRVNHPKLLPSPDGGSATVTAAGGAVVLKLVRCAEATLHLGGATTRDREGSAPERVLLFAREPTGEPAHACAVTFTEGVGHFAGYQPGKYTLWFDLRGSAPLVLRDVDLTAAATDLGEVNPPEGATIRLTLLLRPGQEPPNLGVSAKSATMPGYLRTNSGRGAREVLVHGLGIGNFKVTVGGGDMNAAPTVYDVVSTGTGEIPLTLDRR